MVRIEPKRPLTAARVRRAEQPGRYFDNRGDGLYLLVAPGGTKSWAQRVSVNGKRRDIGLGSARTVALAEARDRAFENRRLVAQGGDPVAEKRKATMPTFAEAARKTFEAHRDRWRNKKHTVSWMQSLEKHAFPTLGQLRVDRIDREDILKTVVPIWTTETGSRVRQRIRTVLGWCQAHGYVEFNAAGEAIDGGLPVMPRKQVHYRALPYADVPAALETIATSRASDVVKSLVRFVALTAVRSGEARGATWAEMDLDAALWTIPAERMKAHVEHRVPLSDATVDVLHQMAARRESEYVFPSPARRGKPLSDMALTKCLRDTGLAERTTIHGLRTSFRTWAAEQTDTEHAVMELALAHQVGSAVERAYARSDLLAKRRTLMDRWATYAVGGRACILSD